MSETPNADININSEAISQATQQEIERATRPLSDAIERGGQGAENIRHIGSRILEVTEIVKANPERVSQDVQKSPANLSHKLTEHDKERAHMVAAAINEEMSFIAKDIRKKGHDAQWSKRRERAELSARIWEKRAQETYDRSPIDAHPVMVELDRLQRSKPWQRRKSFTTW